jgi:lipoyl(octanoyl) transferase
VSERCWRLIVDGPVEGARNMALDRAMLAARAGGSVPATLRLYSWEVPTVSIGRFQNVGQVDLDTCARRGFDVVRRPTGGRGVLHERELTYSVVAHVDDGIPRGVTASYRHLSAALVEAYRRLGVRAELTSRSRGPAGEGACYLHATPADLSLGRMKLSGSAQVWLGDTVLQHGSIVVHRDIEAESEVFRLDDRRAAALGRDATTLEEVLEVSPALQVIGDAVAGAFAEVLGVPLEPGEWTPGELDEAGLHVAEYGVATAPRRP